MKTQILKWLCAGSIAAGAAASAQSADDSGGNDGWFSRSNVARIYEDLKTRVGLSGRSHDNAAVFLRHKLLHDHGYQVNCKTGMFTGISDFDCVVGLRKILALVQEQMISPNPALLGVSTLTISSSDDWKAENLDWAGLSLRVPYDASKDDAARWVQYHLQEGRRASQRQLLISLARRVQEQESSHKFDLEVDPELRPDQISRGLTLLDQTMRTLQSSNQNTQKPAIEIVELGNSNVGLFESRGRLKVIVDVKGTVNDAASFMRQQVEMMAPASLEQASRNPTTFNKWITVAQFKSQREELRQVTGRLKEVLKTADFICGDGDRDLPVANCLTGMQNLAVAIRMVPENRRPLIEHVIVDRSGATYNVPGPVSLSEDEDGKVTLRMAWNADAPLLAATLVRPYRIVSDASN